MPNASDIRAAFSDVVGDHDDVMVVFSGIYTFAHRFRKRSTDVAGYLLDAMIQFAVDTQRTLILPSYTLSFPDRRWFDLKRSLSDIGALPDAAIRRPDMRRLPKPMNSYVVFGPKAREFLDLSCTTAWGDDGAFGWMARQNARICILGVPWEEACSLYHFAEELERVPYRYFKRFSGTLLDDGRPIGNCQDVMFVRSRQVPPVWDHGRIYPRVALTTTFSRASSGLIPLESATTRDIVEVTRDMLRKNPYAYVVNDMDVRHWVDRGSEAEIATLTADERYVPA